MAEDKTGHEARRPGVVDAIEVDVLARTIYGEARGEAPEGRVAVAAVVLNRVDADLWNDDKPDWWGEGIVDVCKKPKQFSCWNENDPNYNQILVVTKKDETFRECWLIADLATRRLLADPTNGATHYFSDSMVVLPRWARNKESCAEIGRHRFFNSIEEG